MLDKIKKSLFQIFSDGKKLSFTRCFSAVTLAVILSVWVGKNIESKGLVDFGENMFLVVLTITTGKVISGFQESRKECKLKELEPKDS